MGEETKVRKPFYKRWWFIALIGIMFLAFIVDDDDEDLVNEEMADATDEVEENEEENNNYSNNEENNSEKNNDKEENAIEDDNNNADATNEKNEVEPQNCGDFETGQEVFEFWVMNEYSSENDPLNLDGDKSGVPCLALTGEMEDKFLEYEQETNPMTELPEYDIVEEDDVSIGDVIRLNFRIYPEAGDDTTEEEMVIITEDFIENLKQEKDFNGVSIYFSSNKEEDSGYSIGMVQYYPNGVIGDAMDYSAGDYSDHEFEYKYGGIN
jgi:flagellar biosynthesis GTPase FlhF